MVEQAKYDVLKKIGKIEIRRYPSLVIARVDGYGDSGFNLLFRFISGNNRQASNSIAFIMPEGYTLETTPVPIDDRVKILEIPERVVAALRFSGRWSPSLFENKSEELLDELKNAGLKPDGQVFSMRYNGPFTPWFLRRNEVAVTTKLPQL